MAGAGDILVICAIPFLAAAAMWLINHPRWGTNTVEVSEPRSHVHVLKEWDET